MEERKQAEPALPLNLLVAPEKKKKEGVPVRKNLLSLAGMAWILALTLMLASFYLVYRLLTDFHGGDEVSVLDVGVVVGVATLAITVISATAGSLLSLAGQVAQPEPKDPPPQVPAETVGDVLGTHERLMTLALTGQPKEE